MLGHETIADAANASPHAFVAAGIHGQIAFGVHPHRAPREVRGSNPHELVVHDHDFRVNERRHVLRA
jgi:hypothetical protein